MVVSIVNGIRYTTYGDRFALVGTNTTDTVNNAYDDPPSSINIPSTVDISGVTYTILEVGQYAFYRCTTAQNITLPSTLKQINQFAFDLIGLTTNVVLPAQLEFIGMWALSSNYFNSIYIPKNVKYIGYGALSYTINIVSYNVDQESNYYCNDEKGVMYDKYKRIIKFVPTSLTSYDIPNTVSIIESCAFIESHLSELIVPASVTELRYQFLRETHIVNLTIVGNPTIGKEPFTSSTKLQNIYYLGEKSVKSTIAGINPTIHTCIGYKSNKFGSLVITPRNDCIAHKERIIKTCKRQQSSTNCQLISFMIMVSIS